MYRVTLTSGNRLYWPISISHYENVVVRGCICKEDDFQFFFVQIGPSVYIRFCPILACTLKKLKLSLS